MLRFVTLAYRDIKTGFRLRISASDASLRGTDGSAATISLCDGLFPYAAARITRLQHRRSSQASRISSAPTRSLAAALPGPVILRHARLPLLILGYDIISLQRLILPRLPPQKANARSVPMARIAAILRLARPKFVTTEFHFLYQLQARRTRMPSGLEVAESQPIRGSFLGDYS